MAGRIRAARFRSGGGVKYELDTLKVKQIDKKDTPSYQEFISSKIYNKYTPMSYIDVVEFMKRHLDAYIVCDAKENIEKSYRYIVDHTEEELLDRVIVSIYRKEDLKTISAVYPFQNIMLRQYNNYPHNYYELISFCLDNNIQAITIEENYFINDDISLFQKYNIKLYVAVVDSLPKFSDYRKKIGKHNVGVVSNFIYENDMMYIQGENK